VIEGDIRLDPELDGLAHDGGIAGEPRAAFTTLKMAPLAPMPSARVATATAVNPGAWRSRRNA
jgi:hypothetical protein